MYNIYICHCSLINGRGMAKSNMGGNADFIITPQTKDFFAISLNHFMEQNNLQWGQKSKAAKVNIPIPWEKNLQMDCSLQTMAVWHPGQALPLLLNLGWGGPSSSASSGKWDGPSSIATSGAGPSLMASSRAGPSSTNGSRWCAVVVCTKKEKNNEL